MLVLESVLVTTAHNGNGGYDSEPGFLVAIPSGYAIAADDHPKLEAPATGLNNDQAPQRPLMQLAPQKMRKKVGNSDCIPGEEAFPITNNWGDINMDINIWRGPGNVNNIFTFNDMRMADPDTNNIFTDDVDNMADATDKEDKEAGEDDLDKMDTKEGPIEIGRMWITRTAFRTGGGLSRYQ